MLAMGHVTQGYTIRRRKRERAESIQVVSGDNLIETSLVDGSTGFLKKTSLAQVGGAGSKRAARTRRHGWAIGDSEGLKPDDEWGPNS